MARKRANMGFTMIEMLIAVGVMVVLMGVAFVGVINYQRSMKQLELDGTAKEIFIAAQNHLSMAKAQGILQDAGTSNSAVVGEKAEDASDDSVVRYWYVVPNDPRLASRSRSLLYEMLPLGSLDDTVRLGGSYVIEYDPSTAMVLNVFYSDQSSLSKHQFSSDDYETLFPSMAGADKKDARLRGIGGQIIGWYGGDDIDLRDKKVLQAPTLQLINAERLAVKVSFSNPSYMANRAVEGAQLVIVMRGDTSKNSWVVCSKPINEITDVENSTYYVSVVLDDITSLGKHFAEMWCKEPSVGDNAEGPLIPGENISVYAQVLTNAEIAIPKKSSTKHANSLFANMVYESTAEGGTPTRNATISSIRHLENIDASISGYDLTGLGDDGSTNFKQVADLRWVASGSKKPEAFTDVIKKSSSTYTDTDTDVYASADEVVVYRLDNTSTKPGTYAPVTPSKKQVPVISSDHPYYSLPITYDGNNKIISTIRVDENPTGDKEAHAGVFATLESGSLVKNLRLLDCSIKTSKGDAGALVGNMTDANVSNVLAYNSVRSSGDDSTLEIVASGNAGGLVGSMNGGSITQSAAAVYVRSTSGDAGGLVGKTMDTVTVSQSYAGGHTDGHGKYLTDTTADTQGRVNVQASGNAGGLVGNSTNATIEGCYSTCSVKGGASSAAGGLVGNIEAGTIKNSYSAGKVIKNGDSSKSGCFAGYVTSSVTLGSDDMANRFFSMISMYEDSDGTQVDLPAIGEGGGANIPEAFDTSASKYNTFMVGANPSSSIASVPYDASLRIDYGSKYPMQSIKVLAGLGGGSFPDHVEKHYGDWPTPETLVVNTSGS